MTHSVRNSLCELGILPPHPPRPPSARLDIPHPAPHSLLNPVTILRTLNMANITFTLNGTSRTVDVAPEMPLLWVLRDVIGLTGTKFGCGMSLCGACTVHVDAQPVRSCSTVMKSVAGKKVTTIEGLSDAGAHPMQRAWIEADVPQCGYCQSGQIMSAAALLARKANPTDGDIDEAMRGNLCRCGTYQQIREAIHLAAKYQAGGRA